MSKYFDEMTLDEVQAYFMAHRSDEEAFHAYMDKLYVTTREIAIDAADPETEKQAINQINQRLQQQI